MLEIAARSRKRFLLPGVIGTAVLAVAVGVRHGLEAGVLPGLGSAMVVVAAAGVAALALSLRGISPEGLLIGLGLPLAAMMAWTHLERPIFIWAVQGVIGLILVVWTYPWWREWREIPRLGAFWLAVPVWGLGVVSALGTGNWTVAAQRVVYGGFAVLVLLILFQGWWRRGRDVSVGLVAGFLLCHALILLVGADNVFTTEHYVPEGAWGRNMADRFWGGPLLVYHPNFIAMTAVIAAMRIAPDAAFKAWQRLGVLAVASVLLVLAASRTSDLVAILAAGVWFVLILWRTRAQWQKVTRLFTAPQARRVLAQALLPLLLVGLVVLASGGTDFLLKDRYGQSASQTEDPVEEEEERPSLGAASSGRLGLWKLIADDWADSTLVEKVAGTADNARGYILRYRWDPAEGPTPDYIREQPKLTADNAPVGALRRGGVLGVAVFLLGAGLVFWRATRPGVPLWIPVATIGMLASVLTEDEVMGTTPAWAILLAGEVLVFARARRGDVIPDAGTGVGDDTARVTA